MRQYIEVVAIKYTMCFPQISLEDPNFIKTLLDPNTKPQVASSYLCIAGFIMCKRLDYVSNEVQLKQRLMENMVGFLTSNSAHVRCIAQYFMFQISRDPAMASYIPPGMLHILDFLKLNKDC